MSSSEPRAAKVSFQPRLTYLQVFQLSNSKAVTHRAFDLPLVLRFCSTRCLEMLFLFHDQLCEDCDRDCLGCGFRLVSSVQAVEPKALWMLVLSLVLGR